MKFNFQIESHVLMTLVLHLGNSEFTLYSTKNEAHTTTTKRGAFKFPVRVYEFLHRKKLSFLSPKIQVFCIMGKTLTPRLCRIHLQRRCREGSSQELRNSLRDEAKCKDWQKLRRVFIRTLDHIGGFDWYKFKCIIRVT